MSFDPYATLHVTPDADDQVIAAAYRALARRHHPDHAGEGATRAMAEINAAWELIGTPKVRAAYDRTSGRRLVATGPGHGSERHSSGQSQFTEPAGEPPIRWSQSGPDGTGAAGPPPGRPSGSVLPFGRHIGWSIAEIARVDAGYLVWLEERPQGRPYLAEIDEILQRMGRRTPEPVAAGSARRKHRR